MENKQIGEYLRKLRQRAGYTQADVGQFINVTYKAISRWESGTGTPELGNLLMLSKLYRIKVDDILNCNEEVFEQSDCGFQNSSDFTENNIGTQSDSTNDLRAEKKAKLPIKAKRVLNNPSQKFLTILFFAFLSLGIVSLLHRSNTSAINNTLTMETEKLILCIFLTLIIIATAITELLKNIIPDKLYKLFSVITSGLFILIICLLAIMQFPLYGTDGICNAFGLIILTLLCTIRLICVLHDATENKNTRSILTWSAIGIATLSLISATIFVITIKSLNINVHVVYYVFLGMMLSSAVALIFTIAQKFSKWFNIISSASMVPAGIIYSFAFGGFYDMPFGVYPFPSTTWIGLAICAPIFVTVSFLFENSKLELIATRTATILSIGTCVPFAINAIDIFGVNVLCKTHDLAAEAFVRIAMLAAAIIAFIRPFKFTQIPEYIKQRRTENED